MADERIDPLGSPAKGGSGEDPLSRYLGLATNRDKQAILEEQIAQAVALRNKPKRHYATWGGALAGGLGDVMDNVNSKVSEDRLRGQESALLSDTDARRLGYANLPGVRDQLALALGGGASPGQLPAAADTGGEFAQAPQMMPMGPQASANTQPLTQQLATADALRQRPADVAPTMRLGPMEILGDPDMAISSGDLFQQMMSLPPGPQKDAAERRLAKANSLRGRR